jgi:hypothetical protein
MAMDEWEARWEDDGGCQQGAPAQARTRDRQVGTPSGVIVVVALVPFFVLPILGMALGRLAGTVGMVVGGILGFSLAIGIGRLLGKRLD